MDPSIYALNKSHVVFLKVYLSHGDRYQWRAGGFFGKKRVSHFSLYVFGKIMTKSLNRNIFRITGEFELGESDAPLAIRPSIYALNKSHLDVIKASLASGGPYEWRVNGFFRGKMVSHFSFYVLVRS